MKADPRGAPRPTSFARLGAALVALMLAGGAHAAPAPPRAPHPRLFLTPPTLAALKQNARVSGSWAAHAIGICQDVSRHPERFQQSGYQGSDWAMAASACGMAWQIQRDPKLAAAGIRMWRALMEDIDTVGDHKACVEGSPPKNWLASIWRDTGYAIRFIGPHAALAYDWLHDAPGVTPALLRHSQSCLGTWVDWYTREGYLRSIPGANYQAGFVMAKTFIAVALAGDDPIGDRAWKEVVDDVFGAQIIGDGLAGADAPVGRPAGALVGGDWPEGWQYGTLSVLEYALSARALEENGVPLPLMRRWADQLVIRAIHGTAPTGDRTYIGGDSDAGSNFMPQNGGGALATLAGLSSDRAAAWARFFLGKRPVFKEASPALEALVETRAVAPEDYRRSGAPSWYLARGTRNLYARSDWKATAFWTVFTSAPRLVPDHQHPDAGNFVFARGADDLIVDVSPYGTRSTMTGNAPTVDAKVVVSNYRPSQTPWSRAELPWARATASGIVAARSDYRGAFKFSETPSDVTFAQRDWVFLPEGEIVIIDRTVTGAPERKTYLRFRTPAPLKLADGGRLASGAIGKSAIAIHAVELSGGAPGVRVPPVGNCETGPFGACDRARVRVDEYAVQLPGPQASAVHVIDGLAKGDKPAEVRALKDGVLGALVTRGGRTTAIVTSGRTTAAPGSAISYVVAGGDRTFHVVFDAPEDGRGRSSVSATVTGGQCAIEIKAASGASSLTGHPVVFSLTSAASGCQVAEDANVPPASVPLH